MKVRITYADATTREVTIADSSVLAMAIAAADYEDMVIRETAKQKITKVEGTSAAMPEVSP